VAWFRGGLVFKAHILLYHSTLGLRVIPKKKKEADHEQRGDKVDGAGQQQQHHLLLLLLLVYDSPA